MENYQAVSSIELDKIWQQNLDNISISVFCSLIKDLPFSVWMPLFFYKVTGHRFRLYNGHRQILKVYEDIYNMKETRFILNAPPRSGKSTIAKYFIVYTLIHEPKARFIYVTYSDPIAAIQADEFREILNSEAFINGYGQNSIYKADFQFQVQNTVKNTPIDQFIQTAIEETTKQRKRDKCINTKFKFATGGSVYFFSSNGSITGCGAGISGIIDHFTGCIIYDDPNKPNENESDIIKNQINKNFHGVTFSRLDNKMNTALIIMQQRIASDDLTGFLLSQNDKYHFQHIKIPLETEDGTINFDFSPQDVESQKANPVTFAIQFQQDPLSASDNMINIAKFRYYNQLPYDLDCDTWFITTDYAYATGINNDYTCLMLWGRNYDREIGKTNIYLIDMVYGKFSFDERIIKTKEFYKKWNGARQRTHTCIKIKQIFIEKNRNDDFLIEIGRHNIPYYAEHRGINASKIGRGQAFASSFGILFDIFLPSFYDYIPEDYIQQLLKQCKYFTGNKSSTIHDDIVDNILDAAYYARSNKLLSSY